tara:strand:- start:68 stop:724 length:657 start_codon:yes stop_codon:yes gene_type:complete
MLKEIEKRILSSFIIIPIALFFILKGSVFFLFFLGVFFLATSYEWLKICKKDLVKFLGILFLLLSFYTAYLFRVDFGLNAFLFVIIICIFTDLGGYIFGKMFKGPKLTKISPNKTYSGMIGSFILSIIAALFLSEYQNYISLYDYLYDLKKNDLFHILIILFISGISQTGDLIISYFKRLAKVKDTGNLLPGHGGLLDRVDGIIFAMPVSYLLFNYLS